MTNQPVKISDNCWKHTNEYNNIFYTKTSDPNSEHHREDGPAIEWKSGDKEWHFDGKLHRENGPAIEKVNGTKKWWYNGKYVNVISQEQFKKYLKEMDNMQQTNTVKNLKKDNFDLKLFCAENAHKENIIGILTDKCELDFHSAKRLAEDLCDAFMKTVFSDNSNLFSKTRIMESFASIKIFNHGFKNIKENLFTVGYTLLKYDNEICITDICFRANWLTGLINDSIMKLHDNKFLSNPISPYGREKFFIILDQDIASEYQRFYNTLVDLDNHITEKVNNAFNTL